MMVNVLAISEGSLASATPAGSNKYTTFPSPSMVSTSDSDSGNTNVVTVPSGEKSLARLVRTLSKRM